jgi:hypothetical protein
MLFDLVTRICKSGVVTSENVLAIRQAFYGDGKITADEAASIFKINMACSKQDPSWSVAFTEALTDFIVHQTQPHGYVSEANANWLIQQIGQDGKVDHINEMELLVRVMEQAKSVPDSFSAYTLSQVKQAVLSGSGPLRNGKQLEAGLVNEADVELLRRILYAYAGEGNVSITTAEAEVLFDINDATVGKANHPTWPDLFAKAVANHLMFANNHVTVDRVTALRREEWVDDTQTSTADFLGSMVKSLRKIYSEVTLTESSDQAERRRALTDKIASSERLTSVECEWLSQRIGRDGQISEAERAALLFFKREALDIDPALQPLLDQVA